MPAEKVAYRVVRRELGQPGGAVDRDDHAQGSSSDVRHCSRRVTMRAVRLQRFRAVITAGPRGRAVIAGPFTPDETWGAKADRPVGAPIHRRQLRGTLSPSANGWALPVNPRRLRDGEVAI